MAKEIHEQPEVIGHTLANYIDMAAGSVTFPELGSTSQASTALTISACGTAYYAGLVGKYWFERYAGCRWRSMSLPRCATASRRWARVAWRSFVSQSGETADTLAALRYCKSQGQRIASIVNVRPRRSRENRDAVLPTLAGPEIGVASTKAFTSQLSVLACLAIAIGRANGKIDAARERELVQALVEVPRHVATILQRRESLRRTGHSLCKATDVLYLGRGNSYPIALEGALKLKEISYIHAEGYAAGELKHGPIALIDENVPVIVVVPEDELFDKTVSNMQEVAARGGQIVMISDADADKAGCKLMAHLPVPTGTAFTNPLIYAAPIQLIAYHTAVFMGTDVDQPRNLAKSVTVE